MLSMRVTSAFILSVGAALLQRPNCASALHDSVIDTGVLHGEHDSLHIGGNRNMNEPPKTIARKLLEDSEPNPSDGPVNEMPLPLPLPIPMPVPSDGVTEPTCAEPVDGSVWGIILNSTSLSDSVPDFNVTAEECLQGQSLFPSDILATLTEECCDLCVDNADCAYFNLNLCTLECFMMEELTSSTDGLFLPSPQYITSMLENLALPPPGGFGSDASISVSDELTGGLFVLGLVLFICLMGCVCVFCKPKEEHLYSAVVVEADMDAPLEEEEDTPPIVIPTKKSFSDEGTRIRSVEKKEPDPPKELAQSMESAKESPVSPIQSTPYQASETPVAAPEVPSGNALEEEPLDL